MRRMSRRLLLRRWLLLLLWWWRRWLVLGSQLMLRMYRMLAGAVGVGGGSNRLSCRRDDGSGLRVRRLLLSEGRSWRGRRRLLRMRLLAISC